MSSTKQVIHTDEGETLYVEPMKPAGVAFGGQDFNVQVSAREIKLHIHTKERGEHDVDVTFSRKPRYT